MNRMSKKIAALAAAAAVVVAPSASVFAQTTSTSSTVGTSQAYSILNYSDVSNSTPGYASIMELSAMGILNGMGQGTYQPSGTLTRAQFAKMIDLALGLGSSASLNSSASSQFSDVPAGQWYTGYVNVASAKGYINGFPDGTFQPNAPVTYAQAITIVVRALGYEPAVSGPWPEGYIAEAGQILNTHGDAGLLNGLSSTSPNQSMTRGDAATLIDNMLYSQLAQPTYSQGATSTTSVQITIKQSTILQQQGYQVHYPGSTQFGQPTSWATGVNPYNDTVLNDSITSQSLNSNQLSVGTLGSSPGSWTAAPTIALVNAPSLLSLLGEQVSYVVNPQGQLVFVDNVTPASDVLSNATLGNQNLVPGQSASLEPSGSSTFGNYSTSTHASYFPSGSNSGTGNYGDTVTAVLNPNGKVMDVIDWSALYKYKDSILNSVSSSVIGLYAGSTTTTSLNVAPNVTVLLNGQPSQMSALQSGDAVEVVTDASGNVTLINASNTPVSGTMSTTINEVNGKYEVSINGTAYQIGKRAVYAAAGTVQGLLDRKNEGLIAGFGGETVTATVGPDGKIAYLNTTAAVVTTGLVVNNPADSNGVYPVTIENAQGQLGTIALTTNPGVTQGDIVQVTFNSSSANSNTVEDLSTASGNGLLTTNSAVTISGILGNELVVNNGSTTYALYMPSNVPVYMGAGATQWGLGTTATVGTVSNLEVGQGVTLGLSKTGRVEAVVIKNTTNVQIGTTGSGDALVTSMSAAVNGYDNVAGLTLGGSTLTLSSVAGKFNLSTTYSADKTNPNNGIEEWYLPTTVGNFIDAAIVPNESVAGPTNSADSTSPVGTSSPAPVAAGNFGNAGGSYPSSSFTAGGTPYFYNSGTVFYNVLNNSIVPASDLSNSGLPIEVIGEKIGGMNYAEYVLIDNTNNTTSTSQVGAIAPPSGTTPQVPNAVITAVNPSTMMATVQVNGSTGYTYNLAYVSALQSELQAAIGNTLGNVQLWLTNGQITWMAYGAPGGVAPAGTTASVPSVTPLMAGQNETINVPITDPGVPVYGATVAFSVYAPSTPNNPDLVITGTSSGTFTLITAGTTFGLLGTPPNTGLLGNVTTDAAGNASITVSVPQGFSGTTYTATVVATPVQANNTTIPDGSSVTFNITY